MKRILLVPIVGCALFGQVGPPAVKVKPILLTKSRPLRATDCGNTLVASSLFPKITLTLPIPPMQSCAVLLMSSASTAIEIDPKGGALNGRSKPFKLWLSEKYQEIIMWANGDGYYCTERERK